MSPPFISSVADAVGLNRGPAPAYTPIIGPTDVPPNDPRWQELNDLREQAWNLGISNRELTEFEYGPCPDQLKYQTVHLEDWIAARSV
jgi:hypothetical protein